jgi:hypothetical protein
MRDTTGPNAGWPLSRLAGSGFCDTPCALPSGRPGQNADGQEPGRWTYRHDLPGKGNSLAVSP